MASSSSSASSSIPKSPAEITPAWMTDVLHGSGALPPDGSVESVARRALGEGVGMLSEIEFLDMTYAGNAGDAPATVVAKFATDNETNRAVAETFNVYTREVRYYAELDGRSAAVCPTIHLSVIDDDSNFLIVMEDLSDYTTGDQVIGADLGQTEAAIDLLAALHSSFVGALEGDEYEWLPRESNSQNAENMFLGMQAGWDVAYEIFGEHIPDHIHGMKDAYVAACGRLQERLDADPVTLVHGDFRMDNLFFGTQPGHYPIAIIDWQGPLRARGMHDVGYLLSQSTQTDVREANERALIQRYVDGLAAGGVEDYGFDEAWEDYRHAVLYFWTFAMVIAGTLDASNERGNAWMTEMIKRNVAAIDHLNCLDLL